MTEEIHEIERLIKQSGELADSLLRLARKLRGQGWRAEEPTQAQSEQLAALAKTLIELASRSGEAMHEIDDDRSRWQDKAYGTVRRMVESGTITPQEAAVKLLEVAVIHGTMTPTDAAGQVAKLIRHDLPVSRRIELREITKAAFEAHDDVLEKIKPFLKRAAQNEQIREQRQIRKRVAVTP
jgi:hypothetical protein